MTPPVALTVAASDSGGGAGIQADLATFSMLGVHGTSAVTAVTAQNTESVVAIHPIDVAMVEAQLDAVLDDFEVAAIKTGMLYSAAVVSMVARQVADRRLGNVVADPVMASSTRTALGEPDLVAALRSELLPVALIGTPNLAEASALIESELVTVEDVLRHRSELRSLGADYVVVTGGHLDGDPVDVVVAGSSVHEIRGARVDTANDHGTGCTYSSAIAARLASGREPLEAISQAKAFVEQSLLAARYWRLGSGRGPTAHISRS